MPMPTMEHEAAASDAPDRDSISERLRRHRERRAKLYGWDRNDAELPTEVAHAALAFQAEVQDAIRDAS